MKGVLIINQTVTCNITVTLTCGMANGGEEPSNRLGNLAILARHSLHVVLMGMAAHRASVVPGTISVRRSPYS